MSTTFRTVKMSAVSIPLIGGTNAFAPGERMLMNPAQFANQYNIQARTSSEVVKIDRDRKCVKVRNAETQEEYEESYDKLILSPGCRIHKHQLVMCVDLLTQPIWQATIGKRHVRPLFKHDDLTKLMSSMGSQNILLPAFGRKTEDGILRNAIVIVSVIGIES